MIRFFGALLVAQTLLFLQYGYCQPVQTKTILYVTVDNRVGTSKICCVDEKRNIDDSFKFEPLVESQPYRTRQIMNGGQAGGSLGPSHRLSIVGRISENQLTFTLLWKGRQGTDTTVVYTFLPYDKAMLQMYVDFIKDQVRRILDQKKPLNSVGVYCQVKIEDLIEKDLMTNTLGRLPSTLNKHPLLRQYYFFVRTNRGDARYRLMTLAEWHDGGISLRSALILSEKNYPIPAMKYDSQNDANGTKLLKKITDEIWNQVNDD